MAEPQVVPITVAIATRNRPTSMLRCVTSLLETAVVPEEVLIVDQSQDDETRWAVLKIAAPAGVTVRYLYQHGSGLSRSRNAAFHQARNEFVAVTDDDCVPESTWLASVFAALLREPRPQAVTGRVLPLGPDTPGTFPTSTRANELAADFVHRTAPWAVGTGANFVARRETVIGMGGYDERLGVGTPGGAGEDIDLLDRLLRTGKMVRYAPDAIIYHERKPLCARMSTRLSYGRGVGALCGLRLREGDVYGLINLIRWIRLRAFNCGRSLRRRELRGIQEEALVLRGTAMGLRYGMFCKKPERSSLGSK